MNLDLFNHIWNICGSDLGRFFKRIASDKVNNLKEKTGLVAYTPWIYQPTPSINFTEKTGEDGTLTSYNWAAGKSNSQVQTDDSQIVTKLADRSNIDTPHWWVACHPLSKRHVTYIGWIRKESGNILTLHLSFPCWPCHWLPLELFWANTTLFPCY